MEFNETVALYELAKAEHMLKFDLNEQDRKEYEKSALRLKANIVMSRPNFDKSIIEEYDKSTESKRQAAMESKQSADAEFKKHHENYQAIVNDIIAQDEAIMTELWLLLEKKF